MESDNSPSRSTVTSKNGGNAFTEYSTMTMRDFFAAHALVGVLGHPKCPENDRGIAAVAYAIADDMLKERERKR